MTVSTDKERWLARRRELRGKNRAVLVALIVLAAIFYFITVIRFGAQL
jgi:hypothetical protein